MQKFLVGLRLTIICITGALIFKCASSQQNYFNVPSSDLTHEGKIFFQEQFNVSKIIQSNTTLVYGFGHQFEAGLNLFGIDYSARRNAFVSNDSSDLDPHSPLFLLNFQKGITLNKNFHLGIGSQNGFNLLAPGSRYTSSFATFSFLNVAGNFFEERIKASAGLYYGNHTYLGRPTRFSLMLGYEAKLIVSKFHLVGDWIIGDNGAGVAVLGVILYAKPFLPISLGFQFPSHNRNTAAAVIEITLLFE